MWLILSELSNYSSLLKAYLISLKMCMCLYVLMYIHMYVFTYLRMPSVKCKQRTFCKQQKINILNAEIVCNSNFPPSLYIYDYVFFNVCFDFETKSLSLFSQDSSPSRI